MTDFIYVKRLRETAKLPTRKFVEDAGMDLYADLVDRERIYIAPNTMMVIGTGLRVLVPEGCVGLVWPKGSSKHLIGAGVVDYGYTGEILVKVVNITNEPYLIQQGDAIAQMIIQEVDTPKIRELTEDVVIGKYGDRGDSGGIVNQIERWD